MKVDKKKLRKDLNILFLFIAGLIQLTIGMITIYWSGYLGLAFNKVGGGEWIIMTYVTAIAGFSCIGLYFQTYEMIKKIK